MKDDVSLPELLDLLYKKKYSQESAAKLLTFGLRKTSNMGEQRQILASMEDTLLADNLAREAIDAARLPPLLRYQALSKFVENMQAFEEVLAAARNPSEFLDIVKYVTHETRQNDASLYVAEQTILRHLPGFLKLGATPEDIISLRDNYLPEHMTGNGYSWPSPEERNSAKQAVDKTIQKAACPSGTGLRKIWNSFTGRFSDRQGHWSETPTPTATSVDATSAQNDRHCPTALMKDR